MTGACFQIFIALVFKGLMRLLQIINIALNRSLPAARFNTASSACFVVLKEAVNRHTRDDGTAPPFDHHTKIDLMPS